MDPVTIPRPLAEALAQYLLGRPMREVEPLVVGLRQAAMPKPAAPPAKGKRK